MNADQPARPANIVNIVEINQGKRPLTMGKPDAPGLSYAEAVTLIADGCHVLDTRHSADFGAAHIPGAYNIQLSSGEFEQRVGWVMPVDAPFLLVLASDIDIDHAMNDLAILGLDKRVSGYLVGGIDSWLAGEGAAVKVVQIGVRDLHHKLSTNGVQVLDVRETSEWDDGHIADAHYMNFKHLNGNIGQLALQSSDEIAIVCASGLRSSTAASIMMQHGFSNVLNVVGGMKAWRRAQLPMIDGEGNACTF